MRDEELAALVARALPLARKIQEVIGDTHREHLPVDDPETLVKVAAVSAASIHANFASHELTDAQQKQAWKLRLQELTNAVVQRLADQVSLIKS